MGILVNKKDGTTEEIDAHEIQRVIERGDGTSLLIVSPGRIIISTNSPKFLEREFNKQIQMEKRNG